jgi:hypothetical protein
MMTLLISGAMIGPLWVVLAVAAGGSGCGCVVVLDVDEKRGVMGTFCFNVIRLPHGRFTWVLLERREGVARVVARSGRDYRSRKRVQRAIERLQESVGAAEIVDAGDDPLFEFPDRSFGVDTVAVALVVAPMVGRHRDRVQLTVQEPSAEAATFDVEWSVVGPVRISGGRRTGR